MASVRSSFRPKVGVQRKAFRASPAPGRASSVGRSPSPAIGFDNARRCTHCSSKNIGDDDGKTICHDCGVVLSEDPNFRAEVEFDETAAGAPQQRGQMVRMDQTHQRSFTSRVPGQSGSYAPGRETTAASEKAKSEASYWFTHYAAILHIQQPEIGAADVLFGLAYNIGFYRGRTLHQVALVCLYLATRRASQVYPLMLIDFAEIHDFNVFDLGKMTKDLQRALYLDHAVENWGKFSPEEKERMAIENRHRIVGPEHLIEKFCAKLDFGELEKKVAADAARLAKCMNRDWITTGRRPAGVAGAAIILAARMNNFRRTLREVVLVAKVNEMTVGKRIEEFKETKSSQLSVKQFRDHDIDAVRGTDIQEPPSFYRKQPEFVARQAPKKRKRDRGKAAALPETAAEIEEGPDDQEPGTENSTQQPSRTDADGFAVPAVPDRVRTAGTKGTRKAGRPPGAKNWKPPPPSAAEIEEEDELTHDIEDQLARNAELDPNRQAPLAVDTSSVSAAIAGSDAATVHPDLASGNLLGPRVDTNVGNTGCVSLSPTLKATEFEDDPQIANVVLSETEKQIKEKIWVTENADWLRREHAKKIRRELKDRELREKGIDPDKERAKNKVKRRKDGNLKAGRVGDVAYLDDKGEGSDEEVPDGRGGMKKRRDRSASESVMKMLNTRGTFSRRVDYSALMSAYKLPGYEDSESDGPDTGREGSVVSIASTSSQAFYLPHKNKDSHLREGSATSKEQVTQRRSNSAESENAHKSPPPNHGDASRASPPTAGVDPLSQRAVSVADSDVQEVEGRTPHPTDPSSAATNNELGDGNRVQEHDDDESEGDADDYVEDDDEEDDEDEDLEGIFGGAAPQGYIAEEEEVVEEE